MSQVKEFEVEFFRGTESQGWGKLIVGEDTLTWSDSFILEYPNIVLHAICTDQESFPRPCVYCQIEEGGEDEMEEVRFVPKNPSQVNEIFSELSKSAALHPDEEQLNGQEEEEAEFFDGSTSDEKLQLFERAFIEPQGPPPMPVPGQFDEVDEEEDLQL